MMYRVFHLKHMPITSHPNIDDPVVNNSVLKTVKKLIDNIILVMYLLAS